MNQAIKSVCLLPIPHIARRRLLAAGAGGTISCSSECQFRIGQRNNFRGLHLSAGRSLSDSQVVFDGPGGEADVLKLRLLGEWMHRLRKGRPKKWACEQTEKADVETPPVVLKSPATDKSVSLAEMFYS